VIEAELALQRLREGNRRFVRGECISHVAGASACLSQPLPEQTPFAIVLGCSDSRVPAEMVFDQGLGDLFVIRVAGNIVARSQIGSIEFAAQRFGVRLVVVLGHSLCGAVRASLEALERPAQTGSPNLGFIVDQILPGMRQLWQEGRSGDRAALLGQAVRANISASARKLRQGSAVLEQLIANHGLRVIGGEYSLETHAVDFFDGLPLAP
jgi:carbonic anhydrase